jgi:hypothetical protein
MAQAFSPASVLSGPVVARLTSGRPLASVLLFTSVLSLLSAFSTVSLSPALGQVAARGVAGSAPLDADAAAAIVRFYEIGALRPHSSAAFMARTPEIVDEWKALQPDLRNESRRSTSPLADDAALLLACGAWLFDNDRDAAITGARAVAVTYPASASVLSIDPYDPVCPVRLHVNWYVYLRRIAVNEFADDGMPSGAERIRSRARDAYVEHLSAHPARTADVARLFIYLLTVREGVPAEGQAFLREVLAGHPDDELAETKAADRAAAFGPDGVDLLRLMRPEIAAGVLLVTHLRAAGELDSARAFGDRFVSVVSSDGFHWPLNQLMGELYLDAAAEGPSPDAERHYRTALEGQLREIRAAAAGTVLSEEARQSFIGRWRRSIIPLKESIRAAGGRIDTDAGELESIPFPLRSEHPEAWDRSEPIERLRAIGRRDGEYAEAAGRRDAVARLGAEFRERRAGGGPTAEERVRFALALALVAGDEPDSNVREAALDELARVVAPPSGRDRDGEEGAELNDELRATVDRWVDGLERDAVERLGPEAIPELAGLPRAALLYAAGQLGRSDLSLGARRAIVRTLADAGEPALYGAFVAVIRRDEDETLRRYAVRGVERILRSRTVGDSGVIVGKEVVVERE